MARSSDDMLDMALRMAERMLELGTSASRSGDEDEEDRKLSFGGEMYALRRLEEINKELNDENVPIWDKRALRDEKRRLERKLGLL